MKFKVYGEFTEYLEKEFEAETPTDAARMFQKAFPHVDIVSVDDREVIGYCESCSEPILKGDERGPYSDVVICAKCLKD